MRRVTEILLHVVSVLVILEAANARPSSKSKNAVLQDLQERLDRSADRKNLQDETRLESLPGLQELLQSLPQALQGLQRSAGRQSRDLSLSDGNSKEQSFDAKQDTSNSDNGREEVSKEAVDAVEAAVAKLVGENSKRDKVKRNGNHDVDGSTGDNQFIVTVVDRNVVLVDGRNNENGDVSDDCSRGIRSTDEEADEDADEDSAESQEEDGDDVEDAEEAEEYDADWQGDDEIEEDSQAADEEQSSADNEEEEDVNDEREEDLIEDSDGTDDVPNDNDQEIEQDDIVKDILDENEAKGKHKREIVTKIEKTLSDVRFLDDYLEYLNKRADQLEALQQDVGKSNGNRKEETERSKRESTKTVNDRSIDYLKSLPQYKDVPREVLVNAVQSLTNGDRLGRNSESKEPVQRQACTSEMPTLVSPCSSTNTEPLTKEEQELERVIELRKKHESNVAREQDEVTKAEHMAHTMQQDMQEVMSEIRQLKKEIAIERKEAEEISAEVKADQKDLEEHDQKKFNARRHVDELYMKLTELESNDCESRSKRQLVRQLRDIVGTDRLDSYESPRQRILRGLHEKEREQAELDRMREAMRERYAEKLGPESDVQDEQKHVRELQRSQMQDDQKHLREFQRAQGQDDYLLKADNSQDALNQHQDQQQVEDADSAAMPTNELVQRSVNSQTQVQQPAAAPAPAPAMPRQATTATECTTARSDGKHSQYNAILQEIIIGEAKVKIEAVEVERAETEVAASRKRMATAMSHLSALVMELRNLQARAVVAGKKAKEAHLVLAYHDQVLFNERRKVTEALNLETDLQKMISDIKSKSGNKCNKQQHP